MLIADGGSAVGGALIVLLVAIGLALLALFLAALVSILRTARMTSTGRLVWIVIVLIFQFFGPLAWFLFGRKNADLL
jgi:Phospholipase_D-nuclease N-terminal